MSMKRSIKSFSLCFAMTLLAITMVSAAPFVSPNGYSLTPAAGWRLVRNGFPGADVVVLGLAYGRFKPNLNVVVTFAKPGETLQHTQRQIRPDYPHMFNRFKLLSCETSTLHGLPVLNVLGVYQQGTHWQRIRQFCFERGHRSYWFTCTGPEPSPASYEEAFTQMLHTIRWNK